MLKPSVVVLFLSFTLSLARTPLIQPENDVTYLKLPSENDVIRTGETRSVHHVPLSLVKYRPINHRFRLRSSRPFRLCRHHQNPVSRRPIRYGNDMILSSKNNNIDFDKFVYRIGVRQIPSDRFNFHHDDDDHKEKAVIDATSNKKMWKFLDDQEQRKISKFLDRGNFGEIKWKNENQFYAHHVDDEADKRSKLYAKHYGMNLRKHFHYNNGEAEKAEEENKLHKREMKKGGIMRGIRKFLHHYFD